MAGNPVQLHQQRGGVVFGGGRLSEYDQALVLGRERPLRGQALRDFGAMQR